MKTKNQSSLPSKYWLIIVIVICVILMGVERITGGNGPISFVANYTVIPMQKGIGYVGRYMSDLSDNFETLQDMKKENRKLQSKVDDLTIDNTRLRQDQYELERLRELYKLDENYSDYKKVHTSFPITAPTGSVILRSTKERRTALKRIAMFSPEADWSEL